MNLKEQDYSKATSPEEALLWAIEMYDLDRVELLLMNGADPNTRGRSGATALLASLDVEADGAHQNDWAVTPIKMTALLLAYGADPLLTDERGQSALGRASKGHPQALAFIQRLLGREMTGHLSANGKPRTQSGVLDREEVIKWHDAVDACAFCQGNFLQTQLWRGDKASICASCIHTRKQASDQPTEG